MNGVHESLDDPGCDDREYLDDDAPGGSHEDRTRSAVVRNGDEALAPFVPIDDLFADQPDAAFLVAGLGIAPGAATGLFGQGFVGKTIVAQSVGIAVALGQRLWGVHETRQGRVIHLDHEQGLRITATRYQRMARATQVTDGATGRTRHAWADDFRDWLDVAIHPRLNLTTPGAEDHYARLFDGHALAIVDALKGATPGIDENSSEMRDYMGRLSRASERTGCAVLLIHHAGKTVLGGERPRKESGRGSSAIFDECQSVFVLTAEKGEPVRVSHEKDRELGRVLDDFGMMVEDVEIGGNPRGGLRVVHMEREQLAQGKPNNVNVLVQRVQDAVRLHPGCSVRLIRATCKGVRGTDVDMALEEAERRNLVENQGTDKRAKWMISGAEQIDA